MPDKRLSPEDLARIDAACDAYESSLKAGRPEPPERFLVPLPGPASQELLRQLRRLQAEYARTGASLHDLVTGGHHPLGAAPFTVGRAPDADVPVRDLGCSREQLRVVRDGSAFVLENLSDASPTRHNGRPVRGRAPLAPGDLIEVGNAARFRFVMAEAAPRPDATVLASGNIPDAPTAGVTLREGETALGRDPGAGGLTLPHPMVSRRHAVVNVRMGEAWLSDAGSANGTFVNGERLESPRRLLAGDAVAVGPYRMRFTGDALAPLAAPSAGVSLEARGLCRVVGDGLTLLDRVTLAVAPGAFVCLLGPSGCGKSTLLGAMSGRAPVDEGKVLVGGLDLHRRYDELKAGIAFVAQREALHETLTVADTVAYAAELRLPPDTSADERAAAVAATLETVGLTDHRGKLIRLLSGGQRRRVGLAVELIGRPTMLFLDEVTSGLDEQSDRDMMALFRRLAGDGVTVVCITHSLAHVEESCHGVAVLAPGGRLAFAGTPSEASAYFGVPRLGDVYAKLGGKAPEEWQALFNPPEPPEADDEARPPRRAAPSGFDFLRQAVILLRREIAVLSGDRAALLTILGQCLLVGALMWLVFGDVSRHEVEPLRAGRAATLLFLLDVCCLWFGCNNAAKAVVGERAVYGRERATGQLISAFLASRFLTRAALAAAQALLLSLVVWAACRPPGFGWASAGVLVALAVSGTALGLLLSVFAATEEVAVALVPLVLIPQIILADALVELDGPARLLARAVVTAYWGNRSLVGGLPDTLAGYVRPASPAVGASALVVLLHAAAFAAASYLALWWQDAAGRPRPRRRAWRASR